jgi:3-deoxy-D-manno-octulosonate 8-phosphate phosphatase KdsC-like HAD superfamily phosphatase
MKSKLLKIKMILMDVDGVLTDGGIIYTSSGDEIKMFNVQDGMGITIKKESKLSDDEIAYIGDDILDMSILKRVGFSAAPSNARDEVKAICDYITIAEGGHGAVREVIDKILKRQDKLNNLIEQLSK